LIEQLNDSKRNQLSDQSSGNIMESELSVRSPTMITDNTRPLIDESISASTSQIQSSTDFTPDLLVRHLSPSPNPIPVFNVEQVMPQPKEKDKEKSKKDKDESGHSRLHKEKKKKKKHKKHKNKHKQKHHSHKDKHSHDRTGSSGGSTNPSPVKYLQKSP
jgi:hypothetical protein